MSTEVIEPEIVTEGAIVPHQQALVLANPADVAVAIQNYVAVQRHLDAALPDCLMTIRGKQFRKKNYWRAVATAFNLTVSKVEEHLDQPNGDGDWGYVVTYRATAPNGRSADGDGACYASEKLGRDGQDTGQGTVHNVRGHAHTRAYNRAVSNLVGFGEVSAEEMQHDSGRGAPSRQVTGSGSVSGGIGTTAPRPVSAPSANDAWLQQPMWGKKFGRLTWGQMSEGDYGGARWQYLSWISEKFEPRSPDQEETVRRARMLLAGYEQKNRNANPAADAAPPEPNWDADVPLPEEP